VGDTGIFSGLTSLLVSGGLARYTGIAPVLDPHWTPAGFTDSVLALEDALQRDMNDAWLRALQPPPEGRLEVWDTRVRGLVLRLTPKGAATWSVRTRTREGKRTRPKLGTWPVMGIARARKEALAALAGIEAGGDPVAAKRLDRASREARTTAPTVADRLAEWRRAKEGDKIKPWSQRHATEVERVCAKEIAPALGKRPLAETTRADWTALVAAKRRTAPSMASLLFRIISAFLGHAEAHGWIAAPLLPRKGLAALAPPPAARARVLSDAELRDVWQASVELGPRPRAFVRLLILTAAREVEVSDLAVGEVDRDAGRWTIPASRAKNGRAVTLPLSTLARAELAAVWPNGETRAGFRPLRVRGYSKIKAALDAEIAAARARAGESAPMPPWRLHDLRRTARTGMTRLGVPRDHAEAALNHVSGRSALERTYDRHDYAAEVLDALGRWQGHVAGIVATR